MLAKNLHRHAHKIEKKLLVSLAGNLARRNLSRIETLQPVKLSYATYETNKSQHDNKISPLVVMHGLFGSKSNWNSICKVLHQKTVPQRKIIAVDARNHGDSPHNEDHTYAHLSADLKALLKDLNIHKVVLLGHSMGGRAVMLFALKYPELVEGLMVVDMSPETNSPSLNTMPKLFEALENVELPKNILMSQARSVVEEQLSKSIADKSLRAFLLTNLVATPEGRYTWRINIPVLINSFNNIARFPSVSSNMVYDGPVLFVGGEKSDYLPYFMRFLSSNSFKKSFQESSAITKEDTVDLSYASYESTKSLSENDPNPLLVFHGLLGSKNNWNSLCKVYHEKTTPKRKIFAVDARNHGDSTHTSNHTYDHLVLDIKHFLNQMKVNRISLLGHSMGGRAVMLFALKYPEIVEKLIVVDISPITTTVTFKSMSQVLAILKNIKLPQNMPFTQAKAVIDRQLSAYITNKTIAAFLMTNLIQINGDRYRWRINIPALIKNFNDIGSFPDVHNVTFEGPVLILGGAKSDFIQKSDFPKILKLFPKAELKYIDGAGHWLHAEKPAEFLKITLEFLNKKTT